MYDILSSPLAPSVIAVSALSVLSEPPTVGDDGQCLIRLVGEIDFDTSDAVISTARHCLDDDSVHSLIIRLGGVTFLDAAGLGALVVVREAGRMVGKNVELDSVPPRIDWLLRLTRVHTLFDSCRRSASR